jgi:hypothetical protein
MPVIHTVKQGEHMSAIAAQYGFTDYTTIWDDPANAALKEKRKNPNVLLAGDQVSIPDKEIKEVSGATGQRHRFQANLPLLKLRLVLEDMFEKPIADAKYQLRVENQEWDLVTDGNGKLERNIPATAESAQLVVQDSEAEAQIIPLRIGHLDPVSEVSGQCARLNNLGYSAGPQTDNTDRENKLQLQSAVEEFQCDHSLPVDGVCGPNTQAKLLAVHGC